jgi:hypothetical protein
MQSHDPLHAALLERLVVGELSPSSDEARGLFERCEVCRARYRELSGLQLQLSEAGEAERAGVDLARSLPLAPALEQRLNEFAAAHARPRNSRRRWIQIATLALAASLLGLVGYRFFKHSSLDEGGPGRQDVPLGGPTDELQGIAPLGAKQDLDNYSWSARTLEAGETFSLRIVNLDAPDTEPLAIGNILTNGWRRDSAGIVESRRVSEFFARVPRRIEWQVEIRRGNRSLAQSKALRASQD